ncbi:MAG: phage tail sheath family protein, partial [Bacteroidota bacterium]
MLTDLKTPGVYINEVNAFPPSAVAVATAVPAFIGYTPKAEYDGDSLHMIPVRISSWSEFETFFVIPGQSPYRPLYHLTPGAAGKTYTFDGATYNLQPDPGTLYYLYNMVKMYFENGGAIAYVVSVGGYGDPTGEGLAPGTDIAQNPHVKKSDLEDGLALLEKVDEVTMYLAPEATLLEGAECDALHQSMIAQAGDMQTSMVIADIQGGYEPDPLMWPELIKNFREGSGTQHLRFACSYWPWLKTTVMGPEQFDYRNFADLEAVAAIINPEAAPNPAAEKLLEMIAADADHASVNQNHAALMMASKRYKKLISIVQAQSNIMPPSGCLAGIWAQTDSNFGVFRAPANVAPMGVNDLTLPITDAQQENLNVDAVTGKSVNAIRYFNGVGILVWGSRTLDGNSQDWRYVPVRRTVTMIEQSLKLALRAFVFAPNDSNTWSTIKA